MHIQLVLTTGLDQVEMVAEATEVAAPPVAVPLVAAMVAVAVAEVTVVVEIAPDVRCIQQPVRIAANRLKCRSNRAETSPCTALTVLNRSVVLVTSLIF